MAIQSTSEINRKLFRLSVTIFLILLLVYMFLNQHSASVIRMFPCDPRCHEENDPNQRFPLVTIGLTLCGEKTIQYGITAIKSILIFTHIRPHFLLMTDSKFMSQIGEKLNNLNWNNSFTYEIRSTQFPANADSKSWRTLFRECATQRLFYPSLLRNYDRILYIDADVLFLSPVEDLWSYFYRMNNLQMAAMTVESLDFKNNWYYRFAKHPYVRPYGINTGVMLMDLKKMRKFHWEDRLEPILHTYRDKLPWGDQDIINVIFSQESERLLMLECNWNYRTDFCHYSQTCREAPVLGINVLHGNRGVFLSDRYPSFQIIYQIIENYDLKRNHRHDLKDTLEALMDQKKNAFNQTKCDQIIQFVMNRLD